MTASATRFRYVCSHDLRAENPLHLRLTQMFDAIREETGGRLEAETIPWGGMPETGETRSRLRAACYKVDLFKSLGCDPQQIYPGTLEGAAGGRAGRRRAQRGEVR